MKKKLLFICSANYDRSPTAEMLFEKSTEYDAKSAGIYAGAVNLVNQELIDWADIIFVMNEKEDKHLTYLRDRFDLGRKEIYDLDISNIYSRGEPKLVNLLKRKLSSFLE